MKILLARIISSLFHPVIFATLIPFIVLHNITRNIFYSIEWMIFSAGFIVLALLTYLILRPKDFLHDLDVSDRKKRPLFYVILLAVASIYFIIALIIKGAFFPLTIISFGVILGIILFEIVNRYIKISIHTAVATAFSITYGMFHGFSFFLATFWIILAVMWSRLYLKKHEFGEVVVGVFLGAFITALTFAIGKWLI